MSEGADDAAARRLAIESALADDDRARGGDLLRAQVRVLAPDDLAGWEHALDRALTLDQCDLAERCAWAVVAIHTAAGRRDEVARRRRVLARWLRWRRTRSSDDVAAVLAEADVEAVPSAAQTGILRLAAEMVATEAPEQARALLVRALAEAEVAGGELSQLALGVVADIAASYEVTDPDEATRWHLRLLCDGSTRVDTRRSLAWVRQRGEAAPRPLLVPPDNPEVAALRRRSAAAVAEGWAPGAVAVRSDLAGTLQRTGGLEEARRLFESLAAEAMSQGRTEVAVAAANRAGILAEELGADVSATWMDLLARAEAELGVDHQMTQILRHNLADTRARQQDMDGACWLWGHNLMSLERTGGASAEPALETRRTLARAYLATGRARSAYLLAARGLAEAEASRLPGDEVVLEMRNTVELVLEALGESEAALSLMELTLAEAERCLGEHHAATLTYRDHLTVMYLRRERVDAAEPLWRRNLEAAASGERRDVQLELSRALADELHRVGRSDVAAQVLDRALKDLPSDQLALDWARAALQGGTVPPKIDQCAEHDVVAALRLWALAVVDGAPDEALQIRARYGLGLVSGTDGERDVVLGLLGRMEQAHATEDPDAAAGALAATRQLLGAAHPAVCDALVAHLAWLAPRDLDRARLLVEEHLDEIDSDGAWGLAPVAAVVRAAAQMEQELGTPEDERRLLERAREACGSESGLVRALVASRWSSWLLRHGRPDAAEAVLREVAVDAAPLVADALAQQARRVARAAARLPRLTG